MSAKIGKKEICSKLFLRNLEHILRIAAEIAILELC
jgi:hypothetical protein